MLTDEELQELAEWLGTAPGPDISIGRAINISKAITMASKTKKLSEALDVTREALARIEKILG